MELLHKRYGDASDFPIQDCFAAILGHKPNRTVCSLTGSFTVSLFEIHNTGIYFLKKNI